MSVNKREPNIVTPGLFVCVPPLATISQRCRCVPITQPTYFQETGMRPRMLVWFPVDVCCGMFRFCFISRIVFISFRRMFAKLLKRSSTFQCEMSSALAQLLVLAFPAGVVLLNVEAQWEVRATPVIQALDASRHNLYLRVGVFFEVVVRHRQLQ